MEDATQGQLSAAEVQSIVDRSIRVSFLPPEPATIDFGQLEALVSQSVAASVPEGVSAAEINRMVEAAVGSVQAGAVTRGDLEALVTKSIQDAAADQLSADQVQEIVAASLQATNQAIEEAVDEATAELQEQPVDCR